MGWQPLLNEAARQAGRVPQHPIRVMLVDDHGMTRHLLRELIGEAAGLAVVAEAADGESAVETARHTGPDVIVMDISIPKMNGVDATRQIMAEGPEVQVIGLTLHDDPGTLQRVSRPDQSLPEGAG